MNTSNSNPIDSKLCRRHFVSLPNLPILRWSLTHLPSTGSFNGTLVVLCLFLYLTRSSNFSFHCVCWCLVIQLQSSSSTVSQLLCSSSVSNSNESALMTSVHRRWDRGFGPEACRSPSGAAPRFRFPPVAIVDAVECSAVAGLPSGASSQCQLCCATGPLLLLHSSLVVSVTGELLRVPLSTASSSVFVPTIAGLPSGASSQCQLPQTNGLLVLSRRWSRWLGKQLLLYLYLWLCFLCRR